MCLHWAVFFYNEKMIEFVADYVLRSFGSEFESFFVFLEETLHSKVSFWKGSLKIVVYLEALSE